MHGCACLAGAPSGEYKRQAVTARSISWVQTIVEIRSLLTKTPGTTPGTSHLDPLKKKKVKKNNSNNLRKLVNPSDNSLHNTLPNTLPLTMTDPEEALQEQYQRDTEKVNPGDNVGVVVFVPNDPDMLYFSYWDLRKERDLMSQFQRQEFDVTLFMDNAQRVKKYDIVWKHTARSEAPLPTYVFLRWQKGNYIVTPVGVPVPGVQSRILFFKKKKLTFQAATQPTLASYVPT